MNVIQREVRIEASPQTVWRHLQDPDLLAGWLMRNDYRPEVGAEFRFYSTPHSDWDGVVHCRVVELDEPRRMAFTWNANDIGADTLVSLDLEPDGDSTVVRLHHTNFDGATGDVDTLVRRHDAGWADHLHVLEVQAGEAQRGDQESPGAIDWTEFRLHVAISAAPEDVLQRWSTVRGMESFFVEMMRITSPDGKARRDDEPAKPDDRYVWRWHSGRSVQGSYRKPEHDDEVCFTFGGSNVSVRARPYQGGTLLVLRQFGIPDDEENRMHVHVNCRAAWVYFLTVLKTLHEHGIDGRDLTRETGASFSTYFEPSRIGVEM
jgi:uncharacterized protein YndB with AHSA1/START domain